MDAQPIEHTNPRRVPTAAIVGIGLLLSIAVAAGAAYAVRQHQRAAARDALQRQLDSLTSAADAIDARMGDLTALWQRFEALGNEALAAAQKRHDNAQSEAPNEAYMYAQAKVEFADVTSMQRVEDSIDADYEALGDKYAAVLGDSAVAALRDHSRRAHEAELDGLSNWHHATGSIRDALQTDIRGGWGIPTADTDSLYETASEDSHRANTYWTETKDDLATLARDIDRKKAHLRQQIAST